MHYWAEKINVITTRSSPSPCSISTELQKAHLLFSNGTGPLAPVASNDSEEGRAKNRRVELVRK